MSSICCCSNLQGPASLGPQLRAVEGHPAPFQPGSLGFPVCVCLSVYTCTQRACLVPSSKQVHRHPRPFQHNNRRGNIAELSTRGGGVGRQRALVSLIIHTLTKVAARSTSNLRALSMRNMATSFPPNFSRNILPSGVFNSSATFSSRLFFAASCSRVVLPGCES